jgi:hypothetical protein
MIGRRISQPPRTLNRNTTGLESRSPRAAIKALEEGIFAVLLEHEIAAETARQPARQTRLPTPIGPSTTM